MNATHKTQRPSKRSQICDGMKLHLRTVRIRGVSHRLITLRPGTVASFGTNYYHETWHILSDQRGARLLARLMWGLSFQQRPNTSVLIHGEHIRPTPFGGERSDPILILLDNSAGTDQKSLSALYRRLRSLGPSERTVRWKTFGLDAELSKRTRDAGGLSREPYTLDPLWFESNKALWESEAMFRRGGFVCYQAPPEVMRNQAIVVARMDPANYGMDYHFLAETNRWPSGEVQIFSDYRQRCSAAIQARQSVLSEKNDFADEQGLYEAIASKRDRLLRQRRAIRRSRYATAPR